MFLDKTYEFSIDDTEGKKEELICIMVYKTGALAVKKRLEELKKKLKELEKEDML